LGIGAISLHLGGVSHTVEKLSTKATTLLETSLQSKACTQNYGPSKSQESQFWEISGFPFWSPETK